MLSLLHNSIFALLKRSAVLFDIFTYQKSFYNKMVVGGVLLALLPLLAFKHKCCGKFYPLAVYSNLHSAATVLCQCNGAVFVAGEGSG